MAEVRFENVHKKFGDIAAVDELNLTVADGEFLVFVGPSGCGKTTSLRMLAGLETVTRGEIWVDGRRMTHVPPRERDMAMVFQNYALYPHMNVRDNIGFSLGLKRVGKDQIADRVQRAAELVRIEKYLDRLPRELSGGQRQRVAVCRAIVRDPKVFLFDEPLSNLDPQLRSSARAEIRSLQRRLGTTSIYVTHDQVEALTMADRIVVMNDARVQQIGTPEEIFETPANTFVASFIGAPPMNLVAASRRGDALVALGRRIEARGATGDVVLGIRAESIDLTDGGPSTLRVSFVETIGTECLIHGEVEATPIVVRTERRAAPRPGATVGIDWPVDETHFFDARTGARVPGAHRIDR